MSILVALSAAASCGLPAADEETPAEASPAQDGGVAPAVPPAMLAAPPAFVAGEVLVKLASMEDADELATRRVSRGGALLHRRQPQLESILQRFGVRDARRASDAAPRNLRRLFKLTASSAASVDALVAELNALPSVVYAEPNRVHHVVYSPNDPFLASMGSWGQPYADLWGAAKIAAPAAWNQTLGAGAIVAVIDTGVDYGHPDIAANIWQNAGELGTDAQGRDKKSNNVDDDGNGYVDDWRGYNFASTSPLPRNDPMDDFGHGTHVAGTIAAVGNNAAGVLGVAPAAKVMALKGLDATGSGSDYDLAAAIYYAARSGAKVINASWGVQTPQPDQTIIDAVNYAHDTYGVTFVAAAGNYGIDVGGQRGTGAGFYPAAATNAIAVGATTHTDGLAGFSNVGAKLDLTAPGGGDSDPGVVQPERSILSLLSSRASSVMTGDGALIVGGQYLRQAGTSMAAPHVAGVAALVRALRPTLNPEQVRSALRAGADDILAAGWDTQSGYGRLNATKALAIATPLSALITGPMGSINGLAQVAVTGSAAGTGFASYRVEYGAGAVPTTWLPIRTSTTAVTNGTLATWDLRGVADGDLTLRLVSIATSGQTFESRLPVVLHNNVIEQPIPEEEQSFRPGQVVSITGTTSSPTFASYTLTITGATTGAVPASAITLANGGNTSVSHGLLATWNTAGRATDHYTITLSITLTNGQVGTSTSRVILDSTLHAGWPWRYEPFELPTNFGPADPWFGMTVADLDGDGDVEVLNMQYRSVYVIKHDGTLYPGWPQIVETIEGSSFAPTAGDITGDGVPEVIASSGQGTIYVWTRNGVLLPGWPRKIGATYFGLNLADMNGDGVKDIVATGWGGETSDIGITVLDKTGATLAGWPRQPGVQLSKAAVGDVDGDGKPEVIVPSLDGRMIFAYRSTGVVLTNWPKGLSLAPLPFPSRHYSTPALADLDGDGKLDIIVGSNEGTAYAWHSDGQFVSGWPKETVGAAQLNAAAVGDIDGDGRVEVVMGAYPVIEGTATVNYLYAWHNDGTPLAGWPLRHAPGITKSVFGFQAPALADVDGDGRVEIVVSGDVGAPAAALHAFRADKTEAPTFPKLTTLPGVWPMNSPAIGDFDGDGLLEVVWAGQYANNLGYRESSQLEMWDLTGPKTGTQPWPMFQHDAGKSGVFPVAVTPPTFVPLPRTGWTATASTNPTATPVTNALDGNTATRWATGVPQSNGQYFQLDLQTPQTFAQIVLDSTATANNYPRGYQVFVSNDGLNWGTSVATGAAGGSPVTITFPPQTARYLRIVQTGTASNWWSIYEITVLGPATPPTPTALARTGWIATASNGAATTGNAIDASLTTRWSTGGPQASGQYFQVDMLAANTITQLTLDSASSANDYPRGYQVFVSTDGASWGAAVATGAGTSKLVTVTFPSQTARYVRIVLTAGVSNYWSIYDLNVYGTAGTPPDPAPVALPRTGWVMVGSRSPTTLGNAIDGSLSTRWTTGVDQNPSEWIQADMLGAKPIRQVTLDAGNANDYPVAWQLRLSTNGYDFGAPVAVGTGTGRVTTINFPRTTARYVRVVLDGVGTHWWSIAELNVSN